MASEAGSRAGRLVGAFEPNGAPPATSPRATSPLGASPPGASAPGASRPEPGGFGAPPGWPRPPRRRGRTGTVLVGVATILVVLALAAGALVRFANWRPSLSNPFGTRTIEHSQPVLLQSLQDLSLYKAATGNFQLIIDLEKDARFIPSFIKGERTLFVAAGNVDAEVDFSHIGRGAIQVSDDGRTATITLPHPGLSQVRIDPDKSYVASRDRGILDRLGSVFSDNPDSQRELYQLAQRRIQDAALSSGLLARAEQNTRSMLESMLASLGYKKVTVTFAGPVPQR